MIVARPVNSKEPCLLEGNIFKDLFLYDLSGILVVRQNAPFDGWTYESLEHVAEAIVSEEEKLSYGWDAYLGDRELSNWVGSSEV